MELRALQPLLRVMATNAFVLSVVYLVAGLAVELLRRFHPSRLVQRLSLFFDALPAQALEAVGLLGRLRDAYFAGRLGEWGLRLVFAVTTLVLIWALALVVGLMLGALRAALRRRSAQD